MGAALSVSESDSVQKAVNTTFQQAKNACTAECNQNISGNTIVLDNSTAGNITFTQKCTANASCYMDNALDAAVQTFQDSKVLASAQPALFPGIQVNVTQASNQQDIKNELTQVMENICQATVNQAATNNIVYATNSTLQDIAFVQEGNAQADCIMKNTARLTLQMKQVGDTTAKSGSAISIGAIIAALIIVIIIIAIASRVMKKNSSEQQTNPDGTPATKKPGLMDRVMGRTGQQGSTTGTKPAATSVPNKPLPSTPSSKPALPPRRGK